MVYRYKEVESTNETAKEERFRNAEHGTVIIAESQTAGKGRHGKSFYSPSGGIYMSVILDRSRLDSRLLDSESDTFITVFAADSVCRAIENFTDKKPQIKGINDVFLNEKKICGILAEAVGEKIIVGIGVNFVENDEYAGLFTKNETQAMTRSQLAEEIVKQLLEV